MTVYNDLYHRITKLLCHQKWDAARSIVTKCIEQNLFVGYEYISMVGYLAFIEFYSGNKLKAANIIVKLIYDDIDRMERLQIEHFKMITSFTLKISEVNEIIVNLERKYANGEIRNIANINAIKKFYKDRIEIYDKLNREYMSINYDLFIKH